MQIVQAPDPVLASKAKKVEKFDKDLLDLIEKMKETLLTASDPEGVGLAAPQVGYSLQIFIIKPNKSSPITVMINPKVKLLGELIHGKTKSDRALLEGCLSIKDVWGTVLRHQKIHVSYQDETGHKHTTTLSGWPARVIQHEQDHLDGILFPLRVLEQHGKLYKSHKDEEGKDVFEPLEL